MRAIDADLLIRLVVRNDSNQTDAAERFVSRGAWVPHLALAENVWVLTSLYALDKDQVVAALEMLLDHAQLTIQDADVVAAALARFRRRGPHRTFPIASCSRSRARPATCRLALSIGRSR